MDVLGLHLQPFFDWLVRTTVQASVLVCLILLAQRALGRWIGVRGRHCLWLLLLVRLALPWAPQSGLSLYNLLPIPSFQAVVGSDAFRTGTGVHASAVIKAQQKGHHWLADRIYSSVPAEWVGRRQVIEVGPMSGAANVKCWLEVNGYEAKEPLVKAILDAAKHRDRLLTQSEIEHVIRSQGS